MNSVVLIGRLCADPEVRYITSENQTAVCRFTLAVDRPVKQGQEKKTDFPRIIVFGRQAENCERYLSKGSKVGVQGRIQTGSYKNKDEQVIHTTDIVANNVEFLTSSQSNKNSKIDQSIPKRQKHAENERESFTEGVSEGFIAMDDGDIPF